MRTSKILHWSTLLSLFEQSNDGRPLYLGIGRAQPRPLQIRGSCYILLAETYLRTRAEYIEEWSVVDVGGVHAGFCGDELKSTARHSLTGNGDSWARLVAACDAEPDLAELIQKGVHPRGWSRPDCPVIQP
jgi:hypothetical protein